MNWFSVDTIIILDLETNLDIKESGTFSDYIHYWARDHNIYIGYSKILGWRD